MFCRQCGSDNDSAALFCKKCGLRVNEASAVASAAASDNSPYRTPRSEVVFNQGDYADEEFEYAGFWLRTAAYIIDTLITFVIAFFFGFILGAVVGGFKNQAVVQLIGILASWLYWALSESSSWQATLGKRAVGIKVVDLDGRQISFGRATGRFFGKYISAFLLCIGFMMAGWTEKKQGLHDMMASALVVRS